MLKNFTIFKRKEVKMATHPTHDLVASDEKYENKVKVGSIWTRTAKGDDGTDYKFLSGSLSNERNHEGTFYEGYVLITEKEYRELKGVTNHETVKTSRYDVTVGEVKTDDVPF